MDGGKTNQPVVRSFEDWWNEVLRLSDLYKPGMTENELAKEAARLAWNAALEKAARELAVARLTAASVDVVKVCRELQVGGEHEREHGRG